ncbi:MAG: fructosamine kinase, partial [Cutibacterium sp.]|nr:fructosamine kinase [Cutibacterium sp.]
MDEVVSAASYASTVGSMTFRKTDHHKNAIDYEVAGLMWLAAARPDGAGIVEVL